MLNKRSDVDPHLYADPDPLNLMDAHPDLDLLRIQVK